MFLIYSKMSEKISKFNNELYLLGVIIIETNTYTENSLETSSKNYSDYIRVDTDVYKITLYHW